MPKFGRKLREMSVFAWMLQGCLEKYSTDIGKSREINSRITEMRVKAGRLQCMAELGSNSSV